MTIVSPLILDIKSGRTGEIFAVEGEGYGGDEVYVVFQNGSADWLPVDDLQLVGEAATLAVTA
jgi:hypothetical protein